MLIVSSIKPTDKTLCNLSLEQKAIIQFLDDQRSIERQGLPPSPVAELIQRGKATEYLIRQIVKRRNRNLFDETNTEHESKKLFQLVERVFASANEVEQFLDLSPELYCQHLSQYLHGLKMQLNQLPEYEQLKSVFLPMII